MSSVLNIIPDLLTSANLKQYVERCRVREKDLATCRVYH